MSKDWFKYDRGCPCKGCDDRQPGTGCHDKCERYKMWKEKEDEKKAMMRKDYDAVPMSDAKRKAIWQSQRYGRSLWNPHRGPKK